MTRERLLAVGFAIVLVALGLWVMRNTEWREVRQTLPLKGEARTDPFYAAERLVRELGGTAMAPRSLDEMPPPGAVLVLTSENWSLFKARRAALRRWVEEGGRLVVPEVIMAEGNAQEDWLAVRSRFVSLKPKHIQGNTQDDVVADEDQPDGEPDDEGEGKGEPSDNNSAASAMPAFGTACVRYRARDLDPPSTLTDGTSVRVCGLQVRQILERTQQRTQTQPVLQPTWMLVGDKYETARGLVPIPPAARQPVALRLAAGRGSVTVLTQAGPFQYREPLKADHARLLLMLMQFQRGDTVWFVSAEDADALPLLLWRYGAPVLVLLAVALALVAWRSASRWGPPLATPPLARRSLAEQIRGTTEFILRQRRAAVLGSAQLRALEEAALRTVPGWSGLTEAQRVKVLARRCGIKADVLASARVLLHRTGANETAHAVAQAIAVLESARRRLLSRSIHPSSGQE